MMIVWGQCIEKIYRNYLEGKWVFCLSSFAMNVSGFSKLTIEVTFIIQIYCIHFVLEIVISIAFCLSSKVAVLDKPTKSCAQFSYVWISLEKYLHFIWFALGFDIAHNNDIIVDYYKNSYFSYSLIQTIIHFSIIGSLENNLTKQVR